MRSEKPVTETGRVFKGRGGVSFNLRRYYLYILKSKGKNKIGLGGRRFVGFEEKYFDVRSYKASESQQILDFLKTNRGKAFFSRDC